MDFSRTKLSKEEVENLRMCPIHSVRPYALMMAPAYVYMKLNQKFVRVRGAFDFFTEAELERLKPCGAFFFPQEVDTALKFRRVASEVRELLTWDPSKEAKDEIALPPASFEVSDGVIRQIGPLWKPGPMIDPFFVSVFVNELCDTVPSDLLVSYRDQSIVTFEKAVISSSWAVFLALHLGYTDLAFLNRLRLRVMREVMNGQSGSWVSSELNELTKAARATLAGHLVAQPGNLVHAQTLQQGFGATSEKLSSRMRRVEILAHV